MILDQIAAELTTLYRMESAESIVPYLLNDTEYAAYRRRHPELASAPREVLLLETTSDGPAIGLYIAPAITARLAACAPAQWLEAPRLDDVGVAIEGVSHLLYVMAKWSAEVPISLLELELQAEVDKFLLCAAWLRRQGRDGRALLAQLFEGYALRGGMTGEEAERYSRANRLAYTFCRRWGRSASGDAPLPALLDHARDFYRLTHWQKLRALATHGD